MATFTLFDLQIKVIKGEFNTNEALYVTPPDKWVSICQAYSTYLDYNQSEFKELGMDIKYDFFISPEKAKAFLDEDKLQSSSSDNCKLKLRIVELKIIEKNIHQSEWSNEENENPKENEKTIEGSRDLKEK